jgi:hypothetical protein
MQVLKIIHPPINNPRSATPHPYFKKIKNTTSSV